jgi:hypothetical protein
MDTALVGAMSAVLGSQFSLEDQKEGMAVFVEKCKPAFKHR